MFRERARKVTVKRVRLGCLATSDVLRLLDSPAQPRKSAASHLLRCLHYRYPSHLTLHHARQLTTYAFNMSGLENALFNLKVCRHDRAACKSLTSGSSPQSR
jgi:hypothetical protein